MSAEASPRPGPFLPPRLVADTERLRFRWYRDDDPGDVARLLSLFADPQARAIYPDMDSEAAARAAMAKGRVRIAQDGITFMALERLEDGAFVGDCGLLVQEVEPAEGGPRLVFVEVGYRLHADHRGRGYATEAATAARDHALDVLGEPWTGSIVDVVNEPSIAVSRRVHARERPVRFRGIECRLFFSTTRDRGTGSVG